MKLEFSVAEWKLTGDIVVRACSLLPDVDRLELSMDVLIVHLNGCPLDLKGLREADDFNFLHDVTGIRSNVDRKTGKLRNHFTPRFAV